MESKANIKAVMILLLGFCILPGCGGDDDGESAIVNNWNGTEFTVSGCTYPDDNGTETCASDCITANFRSDGTYTITNTDGTGSSTETGTYTLSGSNISICENGVSTCDIFQWSVSGSTLTLSGSDDDCNVVVKFNKA
ncbi:MAG: hypothetical protein O2887_15950 [Bacteroidetes bacterium]|nr:hypothetical protein [Bacteroidota bacterium]MDA1121957.1 hypothetical protein [Bacteroidota bacterium]